MFIRHHQSDATEPVPAETGSPKRRLRRIAGGLATALLLSAAGIATVWTQGPPPDGPRGQQCAEYCTKCFSGKAVGVCVSQCVRGILELPSDGACPPAGGDLHD
jgi:hypothetical protein